jgi:uncharacterized protein DUF2017
VLRRQRVRRTRSGAIRVEIPAPEQELLRHVLPQLRELLTQTAYAEDPEADAEYQAFMRNELVASRLAALGTIEETIGAKQLTEAEAVAWLQSINSVRLVLGSLLDVSEELDIESLPDDHPEIEGFVLYGYLSMLLDELVHALSRS